MKKLPALKYFFLDWKRFTENIGIFSLNQDMGTDTWGRVKDIVMWLPWDGLKEVKKWCASFHF